MYHPTNTIRYEHGCSYKYHRLTISDFVFDSIPSIILLSTMFIAGLVANARGFATVQGQFGFGVLGTKISLLIFIGFPVAIVFLSMLASEIIFRITPKEEYTRYKREEKDVVVYKTDRVGIPYFSWKLLPPNTFIFMPKDQHAEKYEKENLECVRRHVEYTPSMNFVIPFLGILFTLLVLPWFYMLYLLPIHNQLFLLSLLKVGSASSFGYLIALTFGHTFGGHYIPFLSLSYNVIFAILIVLIVAGLFI